MDGDTVASYKLPVVLASSGFFTLLAIAFSSHQLYRHLKFYTRPAHQRCIVRILFMVPLYALLSLLSLIFSDYQTYIAIIRDSYEAYALYMFFSLCINYVGSTEHLVSAFMLQPRMKLLAPLWCWFQPDGKVLLLCRQGILQYALLRPMVSLASAFLMAFGYYNEGQWQIDDAYPYATVINNVCVTISLYCLALFYKIAQEELKPYKPVLKFAAIKLVIFFCYWQSVVISVVVALGLIPRIADWSEGQVATTIQDMLICFEMFLFSILHFYAFPYDMYKVNTLSQKPLIHTIELGGGVMKSVAHSMNQSDMVNDTIETFGKKKEEKLSPITPPMRAIRDKRRKKAKYMEESPFEYEDDEEEDDEANIVELEEQEPEIIDDSKVKTARR